MAIRSALGAVLNAGHRPIGRVNLQRALRRAGSERVLLEIGAFSSRRPGWIATDLSWRCPNYLDLTHPWPIADGSVEGIYADNVIEHLTLSANRFMFREAIRVLQPGGRIRMVTPDIGTLTSRYLQGWQGNRELRQELLDEGYLVEHPVDLLRFAFQDDGHSSGYLWDLESLSVELGSAGFEEIRNLPLGVTEDPLFVDLDERVGLPIADVMLAVEARKSGPQV